jgi:hypothetical protein
MPTPARKTKPKKRLSRVFLGLKHEPDRWPHEPPVLASLSREELAYFMQSGLESGLLSNFESGIAKEVMSRLESGAMPTPWHRRALDQMGVLRACWAADPDLWADAVFEEQGRMV